MLGRLATGAHAGEGEKDRPAEKAIALFDGKSLAGWTKTDFGKTGEVTVEDGAIVMKAGRPMTGITTTRRDLPRFDYELRYEAKRLKGGDFFAAATFPVGDSYITLVNGGWSGTITGLSSLDGADASENESSTFISYDDDTWYRFRVRVTAKMIRCWIDDKPVVAVDLEGRQVSTRIETRDNEPLGFATWQTTGALRKVEIRKLTAAEVAETNKPARTER